MMALTIEQNVTIDVLNPRRNIIHVVQEDSTRVIRLTLLANNLPYNVEATETETVLKFVEFRKPDGHGGMYDTTSTGETAVQLEDSNVPNVWLIALDGQCFTFPGWTQINIRFETESGRRIHTFPIMVDVSPTASSDTESTDWGELNSIADLRNAVAEMWNSMFPPEAKQALIACFEQVWWKDASGREYLDALESAMFQTAQIVSISAVFDQGSAVIYDTDNLDTLRQHLTVTATYEDLSTREITGYTLSGTLTVGTSTIAVSYGSKTTTFNVTVSESWTFEWDYTDGMPENNGLTKTVSGSVTTAMESNGLRITIAESDNNHIKYDYNYGVSTVYAKIVYEVSLVPVTLSTVNGRGIRMNTGIGGSGASAALGTQLALNVNGIQYLGEATGWSLLTSNTLTVNAENIIRIEQVDGSADIYVNGTFVGTITSFREQVGFPTLQFRNISETIFKSFKVRCID